MTGEHTDSACTTGWPMLPGMLAALAVTVPPWLMALVPAHFAPWIELAIDDPPGLVRDWKQRRAATDPARCLAALRSAPLDFEPVPDRDTGPACGFRNAVRLRALGEARLEEATVSCRTVLALALWEREVLQPAARAHLGSRVTRIEHFGSYACRNLYGREDARRSSHATADALDVAGFRFSDGRRLRVARDHRLTAREPDARDAAFLEEVEHGACRVFSVVLGPGYNDAHRDHFHLEWTAGWRFCR
jgi:hypothetical protein